MPGKTPRTPWQRIARAAARGTGCRLTADDVLRLSQDGAIMTRAELDDADECPGDRDLCHGSADWCPQCGQLPPVCNSAQPTATIDEGPCRV